MAELELIGGPQSNYVRTCRIALAEKGVPYTLTRTMPHTPIAEATHPLGKIPSLRQGELTLAKEALANLRHGASDGKTIFRIRPIEVLLASTRSNEHRRSRSTVAFVLARRRAYAPSSHATPLGNVQFPHRVTPNFDFNQHIESTRTRLASRLVEAKSRTLKLA